MERLVSWIGLAELLALASALSFSVTLTALRKGMRNATPLSAVLVINSIISAGGFVISSFRGTILSVSLAPVVWFAVLGIFGPALGTITSYVGIERMGVSRSIPISSATPVWGTLLAMALFGEAPTAWVLLGTGCIVGGVFLLTVPEDDSHDFGSWFRGALIFPLIASVAFALVPIVSKVANAIQNIPILGMAVAHASANVVLLTARRILPGGGEIRASRTAVRWFALGGVFNLIASTCLWTAFSIGDVSTTLPLSRTVPLWVLVFSYCFLGESERVTGRVVLAALLVVVGGILVTALRG